MENQNQKWVNLTYVALGGILAWVLSSLLFRVSGAWDLEAKFKQIDLAIRIGSVVLGFALFFILKANTKANTFFNEVVEELSRVNWPTSSDTARATVVVLIMVLISGSILGAFDALWTWIIGKAMVVKF